MIQRVLIDETIELLFQCAGHFGRVDRNVGDPPAPGCLGWQSDAPISAGQNTKLERVGDVLNALSFDDIAHSLGTAEDARVFGLFQEGI